MNWFKDSFDKITGKAKRERQAKERAQRIYEEAKQKALQDELKNLLNRVVEDWNTMVTEDKIESSGGIVNYFFENGDRIQFDGHILTLETEKETIRYTLGLMYRIGFIQVFNRIVEIVNEKKAGTREDSERPTMNRPKAKKHYDHPKREVYEKLLVTVKLRKESLLKMSKDDPSRSALEAELTVVELKVEKMKKDYNF